LDIDEPQDLRRFLAVGRDDGETYRLASGLVVQAEACLRRSGGA